MPKFVVKDMETLFIDEVRQSINLLISNLESVPVTPRGQTISGRKKDSKSRSRLAFYCFDFSSIILLNYVIFCLPFFYFECFLKKLLK